jgi:hypothetical protein
MKPFGVGATLVVALVHAKSAHMADYGAKTRPLTAKRVIHVLSPV